MIERDFQEPNPAGVSRLAWRSYTVGAQHPGHFRVERFDSERAAKAEFERRVAEALAGGCLETQRSLSSRAFRHQPKGKVWVIQLDGRSHVVQFGKDPCWMFAQPGDRWGQTKAREFPSEEAARAAYHKLIDEKRREGYKEVGPRKTPYASPPAAGKRAAPAPRRARVAQPSVTRRG